MNFIDRIRLQLARDVCPSTHKVIPTIEIGDLTGLKKVLGENGYYVSHKPKRKPRTMTEGVMSIEKEMLKGEGK
jgi:hypothetical protein